jgi:hypothetical protein
MAQKKCLPASDSMYGFAADWILYGDSSKTKPLKPDVAAQADILLSQRRQALWR